MRKATVLAALGVAAFSTLSLHAASADGSEPPSPHRLETKLERNLYGNHLGDGRSFGFAYGHVDMVVALGEAVDGPHKPVGPVAPTFKGNPAPSGTGGGTGKKVIPPSPAKSSDESVRIIADSSEQCVVYARRVTGNAKIHGYAGTLKPEGQTPVVGAVALERDYGHVSVVVSIEGDWITLHDANWVKGHVTERKVLRSTQKGYIY